MSHIWWAWGYGGVATGLLCAGLAVSDWFLLAAGTGAAAGAAFLATQPTNS